VTLVAKIFSFSVSDDKIELIRILEEWSKQKQLSNRVVRLLESFIITGNLNFDNNGVSGDFLKLVEIERQLIELKNHISIIPKLEDEIRNLKAKLQEKQEQQQNQDGHIKLLRELFNDLLEHGTMLNNLLISERYEELGDKVESRLTVFAAENQLSLPQAKELFYLAFPELRGKIKL